MEQPVTIRYCWTPDELLQVSRYHFRHTCRPIFRFALHGLFALMLVAGIFGLVQGNGVVKGDWLTPLAFFIVGVYWFILRNFERRWMVRRQFAQRPDDSVELEWQISDDHLATKSELVTSEMQWRYITKAVRTPVGLMLYPNEQMYYWLPRKAFAGDADYERVIEITMSKISRFYTVT